MRQTSKRFSSAIFALIFIVGALIVFFDLIQPTYGDLQTLKGTQIADQNFLNQMQDTVNKAKALLAKYQTESQGQDTLSLAMPSGPNLSSALGQLYGIGASDNLSISAIGIQPPVIKLQQGGANAASAAALGSRDLVKPLGLVTMQVTATGSYASFKKFLADLETNIRIFDVTSISIQPVLAPQTARGVTQDNFNYGITVTTYYQTL